MPAKRSLQDILAVLLCLGTVYSQDRADVQTAFEVASVKPSAPSAAGGSVRGVVHGGPGSSDPGLARFDNIDLFSLLTMAYGVQRYQLSGPDWMNTTRVDITAKVPLGATREQYRMMLQNLLTERFKLVLHREKKEMPTYELVIGKNGTKFKESTAEPATVDDRSLQPPALVPSRPPVGIVGSIGVTVSVARMSMERLATFLSDMLDQTVTDSTGLTGKYDIKLHGTLGGMPEGALSEHLAGSNLPATATSNAQPTIFDAVEEQLGLRLVRKKGLVDILVIEHIERVPTEN